MLVWRWDGVGGCANEGGWISRAVYWRQTFRMLTRVRAGLITSIFRHTVTLQETAVKDSAAITLMGTDVERIVQSLRLVHELWASVPEVAIGIWLLARQLGVASVVPLIICLASLLGSGPIAARFGPAQRVWVERVERRIAVTASMLSDMKAVKMLGLSSVLETIISQLRVVELKTSETFRSLIIWQILIGMFSGTRKETKLTTNRKRTPSSRSVCDICRLRHHRRGQKGRGAAWRAGVCFAVADQLGDDALDSL